ncbi:hypothetical protein ACYULU_11205 [Breznakiellaceae bacterium SP9]
MKKRGLLGGFERSLAGEGGGKKCGTVKVLAAYVVDLYKLRRRGGLRKVCFPRDDPSRAKKGLSFLTEIGYIGIREPQISFHPSAFKHDITEADIQWAFKTFVFEELIEGEERKYLLIGYDLAGNPLEILFNEVAENS